MKTFFHDRKKIIIIFLIMLFIAADITSKFFLQLMLIQGDSMEPTYHNLSLVWVDKRADCYEKGDVIAFSSDSVKGVLVKRIVALPGDSVIIKNGILYINDCPSDVQRTESSIGFAGIAAKKIVLSEGEYFVLGDNYEESKDSRHESIGLVDYGHIIGRVLQ